MPRHRTSVSCTLALAIFLFTVTMVTGALSPVSILSPAGSISGRVTVDGKPASSILVTAIAGQSVNRLDAAARAVSDVAGKYQISGLPPGDYQVWTLTPI